VARRRLGPRLGLVRRAAALVLERVCDELRYVGPGRRRADRYGIGNHPSLRSAMRDEHRSLDPEERRAAQLLVIEDRPNAVEPGLQQQVGKRTPGRPLQLSAQELEDEGREALEELDSDVAHRRVADDDVRGVRHQVTTLDVADEIEV